MTRGRFSWRRTWPLLLALPAALLLGAAVDVQAKPRECLFAERVDDVAKSTWSLPRVSISSQSAEGGFLCSTAEEEAFGPLTVREECAKCSGPPDAWCEKSVLTVLLRSSSTGCGDDGMPWSAPVARGASKLSNGVEVRADASRGVLVAIASRDYFDGEAWAPYRVELPENALYEPMANVHAVTLRTQWRRGYQRTRDGGALAAIVLTLAAALFAPRAPRALSIVAAVAGVVAVTLSAYALLTSV